MAGYRFWLEAQAVGAVGGLEGLNRQRYFLWLRQFVIGVNPEGMRAV